MCLVFLAVYPYLRYKRPIKERKHVSWLLLGKNLYVLVSQCEIQRTCMRKLIKSNNVYMMSKFANLVCSLKDRGAYVQLAQVDNSHTYVSALVRSALQCDRACIMFPKGGY